MAIVMMANEKIAPLTLAAQLVVQFRELRSCDGRPGALSRVSLFLQMISVSILGARWYLRLGSRDGMRGDGPIEWRLLYQWGFLPFNFMLQALVYATLLAFYPLDSMSVNSKMSLSGQ